MAAHTENRPLINQALKTVYRGISHGNPFEIYLSVDTFYGCRLTIVIEKWIPEKKGARKE